MSVLSPQITFPSVCRMWPMHVGARIRLISDGDVGAIIEVAQRMTSNGAPADVLLGTGGTAEGLSPRPPMGRIHRNFIVGNAPGCSWEPLFTSKGCFIPIPYFWA